MLQLVPGLDYFDATLTEHLALSAVEEVMIRIVVGKLFQRVCASRTNLSKVFESDDLIVRNGTYGMTISLKHDLVKPLA